MAAGFKDLLAFLLGWKSAPPAPVSSSSESCAAFEYHTFGRQGIGVVQPQSGTDYPLVGPPTDDIRYLVADFWMSYDDPADYDSAAQPYVGPFRFYWIYYPDGCLFDNTRPGDVDAPIAEHTVAGMLDFVIKDVNDQIVFQSGTTDDYLTRDWGDRLRLFSWESDDVRAHMVIHTAWNSLDDNLAPPRDYERHIIPANAVIDERAIERRPKRVKKLIVVLDTLAKTGVDLKEGHNMNITYEGEVIRGSRVTQPITFNAVAGGGIGIYPGCPPEPLVGTSINGVKPNDAGDMYISAEQCYWIRQPTVRNAAASSAPAVAIPTAAMLQIGNDCLPCCPCEDFVDTAEYMNREREKYWQLGRRSEDSRDLYHVTRKRWNDNKCCFESRALRLDLQPQICPYLDVIAQFCNSSEECLQNVQLILDFDQIPIGSVSTTFGDPELAEGTEVTGYTRIKGLHAIAGRRTGVVADYSLGGSWPRFTADWPAVEPGSDIWVQFRLRFNRCGLDEDDDPFALEACLTGTIAGEPISVDTSCLNRTPGSSSSSLSSLSSAWGGLEVCRAAILKCPIQTGDMYNLTKCATARQIADAIGAT